MRWLQTEFILKGIYLGLLLFAALDASTTWQSTAGVALCSFGGLAIALGLSAVGKLHQGFRVKGRVPAFIVFLLLESPTLVFAGIILGTMLGVFLFGDLEHNYQELLGCAAGGAVLGAVFGLLRTVADRRIRLGASLGLAVLLVVGALYWLGTFPEFKPTEPKVATPWLGAQLLLGIPLFYVLTLAGKEEESEVEIGAMCAALGLALWILVSPLFRSLPWLVFAFPVLIYYMYTKYVLGGLRIFKHSLRGLGYANAGRHRLALLSFHRAVQLDPNNKLAREGLWSLHKSLDLSTLANDPETLKMIDLDLCLDRAGALLLAPTPSPEKLDEAQRLLDLVMNQRPLMQPRVAYWRAVAFTHGRQYDRAAAELESVLDGSLPVDQAQRQAILLPAWQLALTLHEELRRRVGLPQLALPGRRMEAIAAVETHLAANPDDPSVWDLKRFLYQDVTEADYDASLRPRPPVVGPGGPLVAAHFDHGYVQQLGLALIDDSARWQRGGEYLRLAARGLPALGPSLFTQIAKASERAGNNEQAQHNYELAVRAGRSVGPKSLGDEERQAYFGTVKMLADAAQQRGDIDKAIEHYMLYTESERSGVETFRNLAALYEQKGKPLPALWATEQALIYNSRDKDLNERKDRYYYSVAPDDLRRNLEAIGGAFDAEYCLRKARSALDARSDDPELIDWADHLIQLTLVAQPESLVIKVMQARIRLRRGERNEAVAVLEAVRSPKPEKFASDDEEEAWFMSCRLLGDLYLNELGKPDLAVACYSDFRQSHKSGADTMYKLGQAYEKLGDRARAMKCYDLVTAYDGHPLVSEARAAMSRLQTSG